MMPQVYLIEPPGSPRDALAYAFRAARIDLQVLDTADDLATTLNPDARLLIVSHADLDRLEAQRGWLNDADLTLWAHVDYGYFPDVVQALHLGASEILSIDRSPQDIAVMVREELAKNVHRGRVDHQSPGLTIELAPRGASFEVSPEKLIGLLAQMSDDAARRKSLYDAERQQRKRVEAALVESEAFYQSMVETLPLALFRKDREGRVTYANQRFCDALRRSQEEIRGRTDYDFFPRVLADKYRADDRRVMETGKFLETVEEFRTPAGDQRYNHVVKTPVYDNNRQLVGIQGIFFDVTDRILTQNALEQERYLLDSLMHNSPDNIYFKDLQGRYLRINPAKARRSGLRDPADAIGRSDFDFFPAEHAQAATADELRVLKSGEPLLAKEELVSYRNGTQAWMSTTKLPLKDRQGRVIGTFGVSHDITPLKEAQHALRKAAEAAEAANRAKSDFLANMSHEIRTPLNAVLGMTELVLGTPLTPVQHDYLKLVHESGESLLAVINDILDFSKIEAGKFQLDTLTFEFREFLGDTVKSLGLRAHRKGLELVCEVANEVPDVLIGDSNRLRQVIVNLIGNAIKFTEKGEILAKVSLEPVSIFPATLADSSEETNTETVGLHFEISDTGIGIPIEKFHTIFQAFEQADASTTRRFGGTGLGLAISSRLVELMGGRIWVESEIGRGSNFHFTARFRPTQQAPVHSPPAPPELLLGLKVLVVDDNSTNRRILAEMLSSWGMLPILAASADEALRILHDTDEDSAFSLVLTDVNMPDVSGFDLVNAARADGSLRCGIIVMLTSGDRSDDVQTCIRLGVDSYLIKPVKQSELFNAILQALGTRHAETWKTLATSTQRVTAAPLRVLLAEDSQINQKLAVGLLERWGHSVDVAQNGNQAVAKVQHQVYDVVLMDVQMPELDGFDATRAIRDWERQTGMPPLPIFAMTAHALPGDRERCLAAGMDDYISKPIRSEMLFQMLENLNRHVPIVSAEHPPHPPRSHASAAKAETFAAKNRATGSREAAGPGMSLSAGVIKWPHARAMMANEETLLRDVAQAFCDESPAIWRQLLESIAAEDAVTCQRSLHTLKNSLNLFGVTTAAKLAFELETRVRKGMGLVTAEECEPIGEAIGRATAELQLFLSQ